MTNRYTVQELLGILGSDEALSDFLQGRVVCDLVANMRIRVTHRPVRKEDGCLWFGLSPNGYKVIYDDDIVEVDLLELLQ